MTKPDVLVERLLQPTQTEWGSSRWGTLERCPREYAFVYGHRVYPEGEPRSGRAVGSAIHRGLAAEYTRQLALLNGDSSVQEDLWRLVINAGTEDEMVKAEAVRMVRAHNAYWDTGWRDPMWAEPVAVEKYVKVVIPPVRKSLPDVVATTRIDLVARRKKGQLIPVDHKSASRDGDSSIEFGMSPQFMTILAGWPKGYGKRPGYVMVNKLVKTNVPKFERIPIPFTDRMIEQWKRDMAHLGADLVRYEKEKYFPRHRNSCVGRYGPCDFYDLCHAGAGAASSYRMPEGTDIGKVIK